MEKQRKIFNKNGIITNIYSRNYDKMNLKMKGLVLKQRNFLDEQKFLTILTIERGLMAVKIKIGGQINRNVFSNVHVLGYYAFNIFEGRFGCVVDSVEVLELFFNLRYNPKNLALAQYFCELTNLFVPTKQRAGKHLNLLLNSLWLLNEEKFECEFIKTVFEFRLVSISGYMPNLIGCKFCNKYIDPKMFYVSHEGYLICGDCLNENRVASATELTSTVLHAMRFIIYKNEKEIFNFRLNAVSMKRLSKIVENYVLLFTEGELKTLKVYRQF